MRIRPAEESDLPKLALIEKICFSTPWSENELRSSLMNRALYRFYVAEEEGEIAGYSGMSLILSEADVDNVAVLPRFRRRGIGRALLQQMIADAEALSMESVILEVRDSNLPAITLYENLGFRMIGFRKQYYQNPAEGARIYALRLPAAERRNQSEES